jgi:hypothetical protein
MHTTVGASRTNQLDCVIGDKTQCLLKVLLDGITMRLTLPATIG